MAYIPSQQSIIAVQRGQYNASVTTYLDGASVITQYDVNGNLKNTLATLIAGENLTNNVMMVSVTGGLMQASVSQAGSWNVNLLGSVIAVQIGGVFMTSVVNTVPSSMLVGASIIGVTPVNVTNMTSVAAMQGTTPWVVGSVITTVQGSVATAITNFSASVAANVNVISTSIATNLQSSNASVIAVWQTPSLVGTYIEDAAHTSGDKGLFVLNVRNDTMVSVTSADRDYSAASTGPVGEVLTANSPITAWIQGTASIMANVSVLTLPAQGASIFTYITTGQVVNLSPNNAMVTFTGGLGGVSSILGYAPAPANGGAILTITNAWKTGANSGVSASVSSGAASVFISLQGFTAKI